MKMRITALLGISLLVLLLMVGCSNGDESAATPTATPKPPVITQATATPVPPPALAATQVPPPAPAATQVPPPAPLTGASTHLRLLPEGWDVVYNRY